MELVEALRLDYPKFMTPPKASQGMTTTPTIPSWLSNLVSKNRTLQPMSMPIKDVITKYAAHGSKSKKMKSDVHLIKDLATGKVTTEVATYKHKEEFGEIDVEGFKVTSMELEAITRATSNHFFKFSANYMLT